MANSVQKKRLRDKTEERLRNLLEEIQNFVKKNNNISLKETVGIKLIDDLRGISHRLYNGFLPLRQKTSFNKEEI